MSERASTLPPPTPRLPERYATVRALGQGAMGEVWLVVDRASQPEHKAAKIVREDVPVSLVETFRDEFRILASLDHPGLARVFDYGEVADGRAFYTAEYVEGASLAARGDDPVREVCLAVAAVCRTLAYIHARGYVHNDVKPSNIVVGSSADSAKLLDFGLSGLARTASRIVSGTPGYIAPERLQGGAWDARGDLYSIGATIYRVLGGRRVTDDVEPDRALERIRAGWPPLSDLRGDVPAPLSALVQRLLSIDPDARPRHAFEVISELGNILGEVLPLETLGSARCYAVSSFMVGREAVLADVERVVHDALGGARRRLVAIVGRPGLGKTRLASEVGWRIESGVRVASVRCTDLGGVDPLRRAAALLDAPVADTPDAQAAAVALVAGARAARRGALLVVDDAHLASDAVWRALFLAARKSADEGVALAIVLTLDADELATSGRQRLAYACASGEATRVELGALAGRELSSMLASLFGSGVIPKGMEDEIAERSGGNPLLLEEIVRELVDVGVIRSTSAGWKVGEARGLMSSRSARLEDFLRRRCAALPEDALSTLAALAALGTRASIDAVAAVAGANVDAELGIALLAERGLVAIRDGDAALEQEVLRSVARTLVPEESWRGLAQGAVGWLVAHGAGPMQLARAYRDAGDLRAACSHSLLAGQAAIATAEGATALRALGDARALADELGTEGVERATILAAYAGACELVGRPSQAIEAYAAAFDSFPAEAHSERVRVATGAVVNALMAGREVDAEAWLERARQAVSRDVPMTTAWLEYAAGLVELGLRAGGEGARMHFRQALDELRADDTPAAWSLRARILTATTANEATFHVARAEQTARESGPAAERGGLRDFEFRSISNLAHAQLLQGDMRARGALSQIARELERSGNLSRLSYVLGNLVFLEAVAGDWVRAREHADRLAALTDDVTVASRVHCIESMRLSWWAGDAQTTLRDFERLRARTATARNFLIQWLPFAAAAAATCGDTKRAREFADDASRIVGSSSAPVLRAFVALASAYAASCADPAAGGLMIEAAASALAETGHRDKRAIILRDAGDSFARAGDLGEARRCYESARDVHATAGCSAGLVQIEQRIALLDASTASRPVVVDEAKSIAELDRALRDLSRSLGLRCEIRLFGSGSRPPRATDGSPYLLRDGPEPVSLCISHAERDSPTSIALLVQVARTAVRAIDAEGASRPAATDREPLPPMGEEGSRLLELTVGPVELRHSFDGVVGRSPAIMHSLALLDRLADEEAPVLLTGETGTGKEVFARALHEASPRAGRPFVVVNCAAVPAQLFESELFGHRRGAFTGATRDHPGVARQADGGILFLDEIGELPLELQPKLLRLIQEKSVRAVGGDSEHVVDVRVVAATNRNLEVEIAAGRFRADLYYRLNVVEVRLPPLRDRPTDIPTLAQFFLARLAKSAQRITPRALRALRTYPWPGNVRELENEIHRASILAAAGAIESRHLSARVRTALSAAVVLPSSGTLAERLEVLERDVIARALADAKGNRSKAARVLGITRQGLALKVQRLGLGSTAKT